MIKLRGFGGKTEFWDHALESFTLMSALAAVTTKIKLFASTAILTLPPAIVARMAATIEDVAPGRFGVNIVTGWQQAEYTQQGLWPVGNGSEAGMTVSDRLSHSFQVALRDSLTHSYRATNISAIGMNMPRNTSRS